MNKDRAFWVEEGSCSLYSATCLEQLLTLVADADVKAKAVVGFDVILYLVGKVMHVDNDSLKASSLQFHHHMPEKRLATNLHECLGHSVGKRFQTRSQTSSEYHCLFHGHKGNKNYWNIKIILPLMSG